MNTNVTLAGGLIIFLALIALLLGLPIKQLITTPNQQIEETNIDLGSLPPLGNPRAPIKIIEFADFLCPYCALATTELYPQLESLINEGKVAIYFRDFVVHPQALIIHQAGRCANEENKFWEFNKKVFKEFLDNKNVTAEETLTDLAKNLGLNVENFKKCLKENKYTDEIQKDFEDALKLGLRGTPTFFVNGKKIEGLDINGIINLVNSLGQ